MERIIKQKQIEQPARFRFLSPENCNLYDSCFRKRLQTGQGDELKQDHEPWLIQIFEIFLFLLCKSLPSYSKSFRKTNEELLTVVLIHARATWLIFHPFIYATSCTRRTMLIAGSTNSSALLQPFSSVTLVVVPFISGGRQTYPR
jgi:hypothetical protein